MSPWKPFALASLLVAGLAVPASAAIKHEVLTYQHGGQTFRGNLVYDDAVLGKRPWASVPASWSFPSGWAWCR